MKSKLFERVVREAEDWPGEDEDYDDFELDADEEDFGEDEDYFVQVTDDLTDAAGYMKNSGCAAQKGLGDIVDDVNDLFAAVAKECGEEEDDDFDDDFEDEESFEDDYDED